MHAQDNTWFDQLEKLIQEKHMLSTDFYKAWTCGHLKKTTLKKYAKEYYHHVKAFPTYLSALHSRCDDQETRKCLLNNLIDEEAGSPNHPDLWRSFAFSLGVTQEELDTHIPQAETEQLVSHFREICNSSPLAAGIAALYCYESQIPSICKTKIEGLKTWYGLTQPEGYRYFSVHETADIEHSRAEKQLLMSLVGKEDEEVVLQGAKKTLDTLWNFLGSFEI